MSREEENSGFVCLHCGKTVLPLNNGGYRNHCPHCLYSKHVDKKPGDRKEACGGLMEPIAIRFRSGKGYQIIHRCISCGEERCNKAAGDTVQPDDIEALIQLMRDV
jgi:DNA-directed RNA polymerase subunit RPC12/RpoP